jgi:hypothetical protein
MCRSPRFDREPNPLDQLRDGCKNSVADNQIVQITERDAKFRLGRGTPAQRQPRATTRPTNANILDQIQGGSGADRAANTKSSSRPSLIGTPRATLQTPTTRNAQILQTLKTPSTPATPTPSPYQYRPPPPSHMSSGMSWLSRIAVWVWIAIGIAVIKVLSQIK